jgi:prepilin-type N-terminal cleavage/methylation domain-containing protein
MSRRASGAEDAGMTLVEVVITVALLGIVIGPIALSMVFGLAHSSGTRDRIVDSASAQLASSYLPGDIQSADTVATSGTGCPSSLNVATDTVRLLLGWDRPRQGPTVNTNVVYFTRQTLDGPLELHRAQCTDGEAETTTLVVQHLDGAAGFAVDCDGVPCPATPGAPPREVTVTLRMFNSASASAIYSGSEHTITAARRSEP